MNKLSKLIIIGGGGHGRVCAEIASLMNKWEEICILDDKKIKNTEKYRWEGGVGRVKEYYDTDTEFFIAIGDNAMQKKFVDSIPKEFSRFAILQHPSAVVSESVTIEPGSVLMAGTVVSIDAQIGSHCILNTSCSVDHDCTIQSYVHLSPGVHLAGNVRINESTWIGTGASIINNKVICRDCIVGAGSTIIRDINSSGIYFGLPAKEKC